MKKLILILFSALLFTSCEDVIDVDLEEGKPQLTVDAILTNLDEPQFVRLTLSGNYFDASSVTPITNALVELTDSDGNNYTFKSPDENGKYELDSQFDSLVVGREYYLKVTYNNEVFTSKSVVRQVPAIDSITWSRENIPFGDVDSIWAVQFWAYDNPGLGDAYWVKATRNGVVKISPQSITVAYDGSTGRGAKTDNIPFILPIRASITPGGFAGPPDGEEFVEVGETVGVQLFSISLDFAEYLTILQDQLNNGGLFAKPPTNLPTNIRNENSNGSKALGWFEVSNVSTDSGEISWERSNNRK
jgi:hypothetical protein